MKRLLAAIAMLLFTGLALAAVNINTATREELDALPGIGPAKAQAIIDYRRANGPFKTVEDVMKVRGIKEGEFNKIKGEISVTGATSAPAKPETKPAPAPTETETKAVSTPATAKPETKALPMPAPAAPAPKAPAAAAPIPAPAAATGGAPKPAAAATARAESKAPQAPVTDAAGDKAKKAR